jgi:virginiamycin B lyase
MTGRRSLTALALSLVCLLALAGSAGAETLAPGITTFRVAACGGAELTPANGEGVLVPLCGSSKDGPSYGGLATLRPNGSLGKRRPAGGAEGAIAAGPAGEVWAEGYVEGSGQAIERVAADGKVTEFPLGKAPEGHQLRMYALVPDGEGAVWAAIGELTPQFGYLNSLGGELVHVAADGTLTRYPVPEDVEPHSLVRGPDGNLWFAGESGRYTTEHTSSLGKGYVGRMTPAGEFALFPTAIEQSSPGGIAVGPDGRLWFTETSNFANEIASIGTDGTFGPSLKARGLLGGLTFGSDGNAWASTLRGLERITAWGQHTLYRLKDSRGAITGAEGYVWTHGAGSVQRVVPGAPGIDIWSIEADRATKKLHLQLACGGSKRGCQGTLTLSLPGERRGAKAGARLARAHYSVAAESRHGLTIHLTPKAFALVRKVALRNKGVAPLVADATVAGGPTLERRSYVPGLTAPPPTYL